MLMMDRPILQVIPAMHGASIVRTALIMASTLPIMKLGRSTVVMCRVSLLQSGQNKDYLANDEPLKVGDCAK